MKLKGFLTLTLFFFLSIAIGKEKDSRWLYDLPLEELLEIKFYSANKELVSLKEVTRSVSVITTQDIKIMGFNSLAEVLATVPGFYLGMHNQVQPFIMHRGIVSDQNGGILYLVNGVDQTNKFVYGIDFQHMFPDLSHVERIEIVRGPASTLWGAGAATALINVITKSADVLVQNNQAVLFAKVNYEFEAERRVTNVQFSDDFSNGGFWLSYSQADSNGDIYPVTEQSRFYGLTRGWESLYKSNEVNLQASYKDLTFEGRILNYSVPSIVKLQPEQVFDSIPKNSINNPPIFIESKSFAIGHKLTIADNFKVSTSLSYLSLLRNQYDTDTTSLDIVSLYQYKNWKFKLGYYNERNEFSHTSKKDFQLDSLQGTDNSYAIYSEINYQINKALFAIAGGRYISQGIRSNKSHFSPSFALNYKLNDKFIINYSFITGAQKPQRIYNGTGAKSGFEYIGVVGEGNNAHHRYYSGTKESQLSKTHEVQINYSDTTLHSKVVFFQSNIENLFTFMGHNLPQTSIHPEDNLPIIYRIGYGSVNEIKSIGIEWEFKKTINEQFSSYGNITYQNAVYKSPYIHSDKTTDSIKKFEVNESAQGGIDSMWNFGVTAKFKHFSVNTHYRGFDGYIDSYKGKSEGSRHYFDLNIISSTFDNNVIWSFYSKNIFNDTSHRQGNNGMEKGREFGINIEIKNIFN